MALINFYHLAVLYKLCRNAECLPTRSHPPSMHEHNKNVPPPIDPEVFYSLPPLPPSPLPLPLLPFPLLPLPKTPTLCNPTTSIGLGPLGLTPMSYGVGMRQKLEDNANWIEKFTREDCEDYICEDLSHRVFVDFEVFMKKVLHVPNNWRSKWGPVITAVKADAKFKKHHKKYRNLCQTGGILKKRLYKPLTKTSNAVLSVASLSKINGIPSELRQFYHINDTKPIDGGAMNLTPDLVLLHKNLLKHKGLLHWANPLQVLEVKPHDNALCEGLNMPRLIVDGKCTVPLSLVRFWLIWRTGVDPLTTHANCPQKSRHQASNRIDPSTKPTPSTVITTAQTSTTNSQSVSRATTGSASLKRQADTSPSADPRIAKQSKTFGSPQSQDGGAGSWSQVKDIAQTHNCTLQRISKPVLWRVSRCLSQLTSQPIPQPVFQPVSQPVSQPVPRHVSQRVPQPDSQPASETTPASAPRKRLSGVSLNSLLIISQRNSVGVNVEGWCEAGGVWG